MNKTDLTAIIVEDIAAFHRTIEILTKEIAPEVKIIGNATTLADAEILIKELNPSLIFLDIQFEAESKTSFDLLEKFSTNREFDFQVIIITAHNEQKYYEEAFNVGAIHFLTKPIDKFKLKDAINRAANNIAAKQINHLSHEVNELKKHINHTRENEQLVVDSMNYSEVLNVNDIVYLEASGRYTFMYLKTHGNKPICSTSNLGEFEKKLKNSHHFVRIHRNKIINAEYILRFSKKEKVVYLQPPFDKHVASKEKFINLINYFELKNNVVDKELNNTY